MDRREFLAAAAAAPFALAGVLKAHEPDLVLVTADLESRLVVARLSTGAVRSSIATLAFPRSIETVGARAVVAHSEIGAVTIVDGRTLAVAHVLRGFGEPRYTAAHPDGRHAYVTDAERGEVAALDVLRGKVVGRAPVGALARHVTIDPAGRTLWVALGSKAVEVAVVDVSEPGSPRLVRRFRPPFLAHDVGFAPDGRHAWVSSGNRFELAVYDVRSGGILARPSGDWPPQHVTFAGGVAYVTSGWSGTLRLHHVDGRTIRMTPVPVGSYNVQHGSGRVVTPGLGTGRLCILDERGRLLHRERVAKSSHDACVISL
jgi:DNA-binding beta-propeller fold protein YncE